ncbi:hypothetical protein Tco_0967321 [Tanacetum coccineum]
MVVGFCLWLGFGCGRVPVVEGHGGRDSDGGGDVGGGVVVVVVRARENNYVAISRECKFEVIHILERQIIRSAAMAGWPFSLLADSYLQLIVVMMIEIKRVCVVRLKMRLFALWRGELPKLAAMANISSFFESLQSINIQDVKTKLFWEFCKFASRDWEPIESYYTRFYRMMNEMVRNKLKVDKMQVNVNKMQIVKTSSPPSESSSEEDNDEEKAQRDKQIQKSLALIAKHFKTSINLPTTISKPHQTLGTRMWILPQELRMTKILGSLGIKGQWQLLRKGKLKPKRVKDYEYHKEKMMLCKQESKGIPLSAEQNEWLQDTDEEPDE